MARIHSLLVGINNYHRDSGVSSLNACMNDIQEFYNYLITNHKNDISEPIILLNEAATRENIIHNFREKLVAPAQTGDIVLFYYAGHGSREKTPSELSAYSAEGKNETLVCYDSRLEGHYDLADRELGYLIHEATQTGAQAVVILDCCHSGSGTRSIEEFKFGKARLHKDDDRERQLSDYLDGSLSADTLIKNAPHILMAACDKTELALEMSGQYGLFSRNLLQVLKAHSGQINYVDLFEECRLQMRQVSDQQNPQFETHGYFNGNRHFLAQSEEEKKQEFRVFFEDDSWHINAGAVHHLPTQKNKQAEFEIYAEEEFIDYAYAVQVGPTESQLEFHYHDKKAILSARMISLPTPSYLISLEGNWEEVKAEFQEALSAFQPVFFELKNTENTGYSLVCQNVTTFYIIDNQTNNRIRTVTGNDYPRVFKDLLDHLEKIARWEKSLTLDNAPAHLQREKVSLILQEIEPDGSEGLTHSQAEVGLDLYEFNQIAQQHFRIKIENQHAQKLHFALFYMSDDFGMTPIFNDTISGKSEQIVWDKDGKGNQLRFVLRGDQDRAFSALKLFVSTEKIPDTLMRQTHFIQGEKQPYPPARSIRKSRTRQVDGYGSTDIQAEQNDWFTLSMKVETRRHISQIGQKETALAAGQILISGHSSFSGDVVFSSTNPNSRSLDDMRFLAALPQLAKGELLTFSNKNTRSIASSNILEINNIENEASLKNEPLVLEIAQDEDILPLTFDGEFILPLGDIEKLENGNTRIKIHKIPEAVNKRSIRKALKMAFLKVALKKDTAELAWVEYTSRFAHRNTAGLVDEVKKANNILLCIHGILGDTQGIINFAESLYTRKEPKNAQEFDLVLSFDYENLNTPIDLTAGLLGEALSKAGISKDKKISILAHSMGGLVSRYYIEKLGGNTCVKQLIMAGTPNRGSNLGKIPNRRDKFLTYLGFALNIFGEIPFAGKLVKILNGTQKATVTLEQMDWDDEKKFLQKLEKSADPKVPYLTVAGNLEEYLKEDQRLNRLKKKLLKLGGTLIYKNEPNDLAVSVESIHGIPNDRKPAAKQMNIICHHMNYFTAEGLEWSNEKVSK